MYDAVQQVKQVVMWHTRGCVQDNGVVNRNVLINLVGPRKRGRLIEQEGCEVM